MSAQKTQKIHKARAVVIKEKSIGESNKQLTLLAKDSGKLIVSAKGARNQKSKFLSGSMPFCYCDFVLFDGGDFLAVTQIDLIRNFAVYYNDIFKLMYGSYFLELIDKTVMFSQESNDIMLLLIKSLQLLEKTHEPKKISAAFQLKLFSLLGFCPEAACSSCGEIGAELYYSENGFSNNSGFICRRCLGAANGWKKADPALLDAFRFIAAAEHDGGAFSFSITEAALEELHGFAEMLVKNQLESDSNCLEIIKRL